MKLEVGMRASVTNLITEKMIDDFAQISGDTNPLHLDDEYAKEAIFGQRVAHGMIGASFISSVLGNKMPGHGSIYLRSDLKFLNPIFIGDSVETICELIDINKKKKILYVECVCKVKERVAIQGLATLKVDNLDG